MNLDDVKLYLQQLGELRQRTISVPVYYQYSCVEELVMREGRTFTRRAANVEQGERHQCFKNALHLAVSSNGELFYCEGWAAGVIPVEHAWCVDRHGFVHDPTWDARDGDVYLGVILEAEEALATVLKQGYYGVLFNGTGKPNEALLCGEVPFVDKEVAQSE